MLIFLGVLVDSGELIISILLLWYILLNHTRELPPPEISNFYTILSEIQSASHTAS